MVRISVYGRMISSLLYLVGVVPNVQPAVIAGHGTPWMRWMEIDCLDTLAPCRQHI